MLDVLLLLMQLLELQDSLPVATAAAATIATHIDRAICGLAVMQHVQDHAARPSHT
jgi:hypothetical protein